ncbi:MAG: phosphotransferase [Gammaproteobacteria bacterium]
MAGVWIVSVDIGTSTRIRLAVDHDGPEDLSRRWFVKIPSLDWRARTITSLPRLLHNEVRFYNELAGSIPINKPTALAGKSLFGRGATLVLNDVTEWGARPGRPGDELTPDQARQVIEQIARLQAHFWTRAHTDPTFRWLAGPIRRLEDHLGTALAVSLMKRGLKRAGKAVPQHLHAPAMRYAQNRRRVMHYLSDGPQTIVHHDCHPGNIFWCKSGPGLLDWQLIRIGEGVGDIAYFLATSLSPKTRRSHGAKLLDFYVQCLTAFGVEGVDKKSIQHRFRAHLVYPFEAMIATLAVGGMMNVRDNFRLIQRAASAIEDYETFSALPF